MEGVSTLACSNTGDWFIDCPPPPMAASFPESSLCSSPPTLCPFFWYVTCPSPRQDRAPEDGNHVQEVKCCSHLKNSVRAQWLANRFPVSTKFNKLNQQNSRCKTWRAQGYRALTPNHLKHLKSERHWKCVSSAFHKTTVFQQMCDWAT